MSTRSLTTLLRTTTTTTTAFTIRPRILSALSHRVPFTPSSRIPITTTTTTRRITTTSPTHLSPTQRKPMAQVTIDRTVAGENWGMDDTSGQRHAVWIATEPYSKRPSFAKLARDIDTDVLIVGAGIAGISTAYETVQAGLRTTIIEAREVLSGETGRTSGHLSSVNGDPRFYDLIDLFGEEGARKWYDSQQYALERVGAIARAEGIECEYRVLPAQIVVAVSSDHPDYAKHNDLKREYDALVRLGIPATFHEHATVGAAYRGAMLEVPKQATYHPTKYLHGVLNALKGNPLFECYTHTRMEASKEHGAGAVTVTTEGKHTINAKHLVLSTNVPPNALEIIGKQSYYRTYSVALQVPKGHFPDVLLYNNDDPYIYVRKTAHPDPRYEYVIIGGEDHQVGKDTTEGYLHEHFNNLKNWMAQNYPLPAGSQPAVAEFCWSGQIIEPNDEIAYIGLNTGATIKNTYVCTGDSGNGLTHGVAAARIFADQLAGKNNADSAAWAALYSPSRKPRARTIPEVVKENLPQQAAYARWVSVDVPDIESIPPCSGAVMHAGLAKLKKPLAVYKDGEGKVTTFSAICPHLHGVVAWNAAEQSWDCPVHGSRFDGRTGKCVMGPAIHGLNPEDKAAERSAQGESG